MPFTDSRVWDFIDHYYQQRIDRTVLARNDYVIRKCGYCRLIYQQQILTPERMLDLYESWTSTSVSLEKKRHGKRQMFIGYAREIINIGEFIEKAPHATRILEFGLGWGYWLNLARAFGYETTGLDLSPSRQDFAQKNGLRIVESLDVIADERFDYIYSNQVIEHISEPGDTLKRLKRLLRPGGVIHLQVPDEPGIEKRLKHPDWRAGKDALQPLEHINCFNRRSFERFAQDNELRLVYRPLILGRANFKIVWKNVRQHIRDRCHSTQVFLRLDP